MIITNEMTNEEKKIINKILFFAKIKSSVGLGKMYPYLHADYSCNHCKYFVMDKKTAIGYRGKKCSSPRENRKEFLIGTPVANWCLFWTKPENWVNRKIK